MCNRGLPAQCVIDSCLVRDVSQSPKCSEGSHVQDVNPGKHDTHNGTQNCGHDVAFVADGWEYSRSPVKLDGPCVRLALSHVRDGT